MSTSLMPTSGSTPPPILPAGERPARVITTRPQVPISDQELRARLQWSHKSSSHFQLSYDRIAFSDPQMDTLVEALEAGYTQIFGLTHESFTDRLQVYAIDQRATGLLGRAVRAHFNPEERSIYLLQTSSQHIYTELVRLLVHAMRFHRYTKHYDRTPGWRLMEDGFSIFLNRRLSPLNDVFPFYGAESEVIAHHLYNKHSCGLCGCWRDESHSLEHVVLSGAFFLNLGDSFGDDRVVTFSKAESEITDHTFRDFFGSTLEELESSWKEHLPTSLLTLTRDEQEEMIFKWDQQIDCRRH